MLWYFSWKSSSFSSSSRKKFSSLSSWNFYVIWKIVRSYYISGAIIYSVPPQSVNYSLNFIFSSFESIMEFACYALSARFCCVVCIYCNYYYYYCYCYCYMPSWCSMDAHFSIIFFISLSLILIPSLFEISSIKAVF